MGMGLIFTTVSFFNRNPLSVVYGVCIESCVNNVIMYVATVPCQSLVAQNNCIDVVQLFFTRGLREVNHLVGSRGASSKQIRMASECGPLHPVEARVGVKGIGQGFIIIKTSFCF